MTASGSARNVSPPPVLSDATLELLDPSVQRPAYDRSVLRVGIVHVGVGGFHRAHMAMALDKLMSQGEALDFAICGIGLLESDRRMDAVLSEQNGLTRSR